MDMSAVTCNYSLLLFSHLNTQQMFILSVLIMCHVLHQDQLAIWHHGSVEVCHHIILSEITELIPSTPTCNLAPWLRT